MLRLNLLLRGSAPTFTSNSIRTAGRRHSRAKTPHRRYHGAYLFCAVGGFIVADNTINMAPLELAGRPGNLTDEQKVKLKEMWSTAFKVFGVAEQDSVRTGDTGDVTEVARTNTEMEKEKKGGKLGSLFKKKNKDSSASTGSTELPNDVSKLSISDGDDKYSQTKEFKEALATSTPQEIHDTFWKMVKADHPDALFLRFLRARKWDVNKALVMLVATMRWRNKELDVEDLVMKGELDAVEKKEEGFLKQLRLGKSYLHGVDLNERPICLVRTRLHHSSDQQPEDLEKFTVWEMETARLMLTGSVDTACVIFDMTGFTLSNMDYTPVKFLIKAFEAHYPESLGVCLVHKAPWVFQGIWSIIKGWLDPVVASKIHFTRSVSDLEKFIPKSRILSELEGDENWEYQYIEPVPGENDIMKDTATRDKILEERAVMVENFENATKAWISGDDEKAAERNAIAEELNANYWKLDPYVRARTLYDRTGAIGERGGFLYPNEKKEETTVV